MANTSAVNLAETVNKLLTEYAGDVRADVEETITAVAKETAKKLQQESRAKFGNGDYAKGWTSQVEKGRVTVGAVVYGKKPTYALAHLLEFGHVTRNGTGRTFARTPAHEHIQPINEWAQDEAGKRIASRLERGT